MMNPYSKNLDEHIKNLQDELDEAHRVLAKRGGNVLGCTDMMSMPHDRFALTAKWAPMVKHIKKEKDQYICALHLEYAMKYTKAVVGKDQHPALSILMPCIARMYG